MLNCANRVSSESLIVRLRVEGQFPSCDYQALLSSGFCVLKYARLFIAYTAILCNATPCCTQPLRCSINIKFLIPIHRHHRSSSILIALPEESLEPATPGLVPWRIEVTFSRLLGTTGSLNISRTRGLSPLTLPPLLHFRRCW
jgi:hypothetical protein